MGTQHNDRGKEARAKVKKIHEEEKKKANERSRSKFLDDDMTCRKRGGRVGFTRNIIILVISASFTPKKYNVTFMCITYKGFRRE